MSIPVELDDLRAATERYGWAYLLTVRSDGRPHVVAVSPTWDERALVMSVGRGTAANATERPAVTLCYPPPESDGYSLIVDGTAVADATGEPVVRFEATGAVLHRPAAPGSPGGVTGCGNDCAPVTPS